ncbi:MAG TPA: DNA-3-methyladenine glycosylase I [Nitrospiria bacterium]
MTEPSGKTRCTWPGDDPLYISYHDREWGVPVHNDKKLFEFLTLEGAQAGLSWLTILKKRPHYRKVFEGFDPARVARYDKRKVHSLLKDPGIVRNRLKVESTVSNAKAFLKVREEFGSFNRFIWGFVDGSPVHYRRRSLKDIPPKTPVSDRMSKELQSRGFRFVGSTICYAFMQAVGMVNDHTLRCFRHAQLKRNGR